MQPKITKDQIIECLMQGKRSKEIAAEVFLSHRTVETYIQNMKDEHGVSTIAQLVIKVGVTSILKEKSKLESTNSALTRQNAKLRGLLALVAETEMAPRSLVKLIEAELA